jgi:hypothetical protein
MRFEHLQLHKLGHLLAIFLKLVVHLSEPLYLDHLDQRVVNASEMKPKDEFGERVLIGLVSLVEVLQFHHVTHLGFIELKLSIVLEFSIDFPNNDFLQSLKLYFLKSLPLVEFV